MASPMMKRVQKLRLAYKKVKAEGFPVQAPEGAPINDGDKITIAGLRYMKNGRIVMNCKPGLETIMTVKLVPPVIEPTLPSIMERK